MAMNHLIRTRTVLGLVAATSLLALSACGGGSDSADSSGASDKDASASASPSADASAEAESLGDALAEASLPALSESLPPPHAERLSRAAAVTRPSTDRKRWVVRIV